MEPSIFNYLLVIFDKGLYSERVLVVLWFFLPYCILLSVFAIAFLGGVNDKVRSRSQKNQARANLAFVALIGYVIVVMGLLIHSQEPPGFSVFNIIMLPIWSTVILAFLVFLVIAALVHLWSAVRWLFGEIQTALRK